jgi:hypothetical protein
MNPESKLLLDELDKRFAAADKRFDSLERQIQNNHDSTSTRIQALEKAAQDFDEWCPGVDGVIDDLKIEVAKLSTLKLEVSKITKYWERSMVDSATPAPGVFATEPPSPVTAAASDHKSASPRELKPALGGDFTLPRAHLRDS